MKTPRTALMSLILALSPLLQAEDVIYYHPKSDEISELVIENPTSETQDFWILLYENEFIEEAHFEISGYSKKKVYLPDYKLAHQDFTVLIKNKSLKLPSGFQKEASTLFEKSVIPLQKIKLSSVNLWIKSQNIQIEFLNRARKVIKTQSLKSGTYLKSINLEVISPAGASKMRIQSSHKMAFTADNQVTALVDHTRKPAVSDQPVAYFLVKNGDRSSFIAPIKKPELIKKAREEISNFQGFMVFAEIDFNEDDVNRNLLSPLQPYWNWKITEVTGLSQIGADWCQAYPEMIERMLFQLIGQKQVCFRGQRIVRELKPEEL